jgi:hypothetical protein
MKGLSKNPLVPIFAVDPKEAMVDISLSFFSATLGSSYEKLMRT